MSDKFTYFDDSGNAEISEVEPRVGVGKVWVRGEYQPPIYPSPTDVRVAAGNKVWIIIDALSESTVDDVIDYYRPHMTRQDVEAAVRFYLTRKGEIDAKLAEHHAVA